MSGLDLAALKSRATAPYVFGATVDLTGLRVTAPLDLSRCRLTNIDFSGTVFEAPVTFARATFSGLAWFKGCTFERPADFSSCLFESDVRFDRAQLLAPFNLDHAEIRGVGAFDAARFQRVRFDHLTALGNLSFAAATFAADASFRDMQCLGGLWLDGTRFDGAADFHGTDVHGRTWLRDLQTRRADGRGDVRTPQDDGLVAYGYVYGRGAGDPGP